ncbi:MAG: hypothetical protein IPK19_41495 [Chloroflexi bacterium]|nr:hypothetical protein [Chloroflexota bacterium]
MSALLYTGSRSALDGVVPGSTTCVCRWSRAGSPSFGLVRALCSTKLYSGTSRPRAVW